MKHHSALNIKGLIFSISLGEGEKERSTKQKVSLDIKLFYVTKPELCKNDAGNYVCYDKLGRHLHDFMNNKSFRYVEYLAEQLHTVIKKHIDDDNVHIWLKIYKCNPPVPFEIGEFSFEYTDLPSGL